MPSEEYERFRAAVVRSQTAFGLPGMSQQQLTDWLQRLLDAGDPDAHADVDRQWRDALRLPGSLEDAEAWPDDLDESDGIDVPADDPLYGWRYWSVFNNRLVAPYLTAKTGVPTYHPTAKWKPGDNTSSTRYCRSRGPHPGPDRRCGCGIRAMASWELIERLVANSGKRDRTVPVAIGRVAMWGRVTGRSYGDDPPYTIRATHARLVELYVEDNDQLEAKLRATYAVPDTDDEEES